MRSDHSAHVQIREHWMRWLIQRARDRFGEGPLLAQDETLRLGQLEIGAALRVESEPGTAGFVCRQSIEADQAPGNVVAALMRQEVAPQVAAAARNDVLPILRKVLNASRLNGSISG